MWGETMKETYRVPRPPVIAGNENLVNFEDSEELLSVLGFCAPEASTAPAGKQRKIRELHAIETTGSRADDDHRACQKSHPFHSGWGEVELTANAK
jgi:hypothetical protein